MIATGEQSRAVEGPEVGHLLHHAQRPFLAARVLADRAGIRRVDIAADRAGRELVGDVAERGEQRLERRLTLLHQMKHGTPRRAGTEPRQPRKRLRQRFNLLTSHGFSLSLRAERSNPETRTGLLRRVAPRYD